jgi:hypothetical protein
VADGSGVLDAVGCLVKVEEGKGVEVALGMGVYVAVSFKVGVLVEEGVTLGSLEISTWPSLIEVVVNWPSTLAS